LSAAQPASIAVIIAMSALPLRRHMFNLQTFPGRDKAAFAALTNPRTGAARFLSEPFLDEVPLGYRRDIVVGSVLVPFRQFDGLTFHPLVRDQAQ
jgi:hypothetical protein